MKNLPTFPTLLLHQEAVHGGRLLFLLLCLKTAVSKCMTWHLGIFPKPMEMLIWQMASLLPYIPWFKCPKSPGRASCAGNQRVREAHRRQQPPCPHENLQENTWDQLLNTPTNKAQDWKWHFAASWQQSPCWQGATQHQMGAEPKPLFLHTHIPPTLGHDLEIRKRTWQFNI